MMLRVQEELGFPAPAARNIPSNAVGMQFIIKTMMAEESDQGSTLEENSSVIAWVANMCEEGGPMTPMSLRR